MASEASMTEKATLILLAGGKSMRMGQPKHLLLTSRGTLIEHLDLRLRHLFSETLAVGRDLPPMGLRSVDDLYPAQSPLVGIYSGLVASRADVNFVLACDMPFVNPALVSHLISYAGDVDVVVPVVNGYYEPLCAVYCKRAIPVIKELLNRNVLKVTEAYSQLLVREVPGQRLRVFDPELSSFINLNTPRELALLNRI
jgi:molybdopterin-guanine dinucleotide biosynthesis protein A